MKRILFTAVVVCALMLSGCNMPDIAKIGGADGPTDIIVSEKKEDEWGITLSAKSVTNKGLTILFAQSGGSPTGELQTGSEFWLEYNDNGEWKSVETNPMLDYAWHQIAYSINKNDITELETDWQWLYGELPSGFYKLKKEIIDFRAAGDFDKKMYELYFAID